jgi:hypothetical protein
VLLIGIPALQVNEGRKVSNKRKGHYKSDDDPQWAHLSENAKGTPTYAEKIAEQQRIRLKNNTKDGFVALRHDMTGSPAWKALGSGARDAYAWIDRRYRKTNNGKIPMGARELAEKMGVGKDAANRYLLRLEALGFIAPAKHGHFGDRTGARRSTRWRLTEYGMDGALPTRDYLNFGLVEANQRARAASRRDPKRLHPRRRENFVRPQKTDLTSAKDGRVRPQNADTDPISVHGIEPLASAKYGQSTAVPGEAPETAADTSITAGTPETGRSTSIPPAHADARGQTPPSSSKQKKVLGPHAKRSAAAKPPLNGADTDVEVLKEKFSVLAKRKNRGLKNLARKLQ